MTTTIKGKDGIVLVEDLPDGRRSLTVTPHDSETFVLGSTWETSYPIALIQLMVETSGTAYLVDSLRRDEDPDYVRKYLANDLLAYFKAEDFAGKQILDFGCGSGSSSVILAQMFPQTQITGVELFPSLLAIARERVAYYKLSNVEFYESPSGSELPADIGRFDFVIMSAVFEHLLPPERHAVIPKLWRAVRPGGYFFLNQTPNRHFPVELHTTMLPVINYLPDGLALVAARRFSKRIKKDETWEQLLRKGVRGATDREIMGLLPRDSGIPVMLEPCNNGMRDRIDLYYSNTDPNRLKMLKTITRVVIKGLYAITGLAFVPDLSLAFHKQLQDGPETAIASDQL